MPHDTDDTEPPDLLVTGHFDEGEGYAVYRRQGSGNWLITLTIAGQGLYRQSGVSLPALPGDLVLLAPGALHDYSVPPGGRWEFFWAHFHPRPTWHGWWSLPEVGRGLFALSFRDPAVRSRAETVFGTLHRDQASDDALRGELALNGLEAVLLLATREQTVHRRAIDPRVRQALELVGEDLAAPHTPASLAQAVALSTSRLAHLVRAETGETIGEAILGLRMRQAARLLTFTTRGVGEIAEDVGFNSAYYFSRQFRRRFGLNPRAYRRARDTERLTADRP